ncbi:MAG TPA: ArdC family protein [Gemmataceae bacterium]|nr:ArdC family protein [Gemmataceae bacterium]
MPGRRGSQSWSARRHRPSPSHRSRGPREAAHDCAASQPKEKSDERDDQQDRHTEAEARADIYQRITDSIAAAIETGAGEWRMPWHSAVDGQAPVLPVNVATGRPYRGINVLVLWAAAQTKSAAPLSANSSRNPLCLRARAPMIASSYS